MPSHSSYTYNNSTHGLGQLMISEEAYQIYDRRRATHPTRLPVRSSGRSTIQPVVPPRTLQPIVTTSVPQTGGSYPILQPATGSGDHQTEEPTSGASFLTLDGDHIVIAGDHRLKKKQAIMVGAGLAGAAVLLKYIL